LKIQTTLIDKRLDINSNLNLKHLIKEHHNIVDIKDSLVTGSFTYDLEVLKANLKVQNNLVLAESKTLEPIDYELTFNLDLIFGSSKDSDYALEDEIFLDEIIYGHILLYKPQVIYLEEDKVEKPIKKVNPAFSNLKDWK